MMDSLDGDNTHAGDITRRLKQEHIRVIEEENKLHLLTTLKKRGLSTRDIMAFIKKQADNRTILKSLDKGLASRAMTYKIRDCKSVLFVHRKNRSDLKTEYIRSTGGKKYHIRRILRSARNEYNKQDLRSKQKMEKKIQHLGSIQKEWDNLYKNPVKPFEPTRTPPRLKEYSGLSVFGLPSNLPARQASLGPFICDNSIRLTEGERKVLSRDPKYSLMTDCSSEDFDTESERSLAKHRYGTAVKNEREKKEKKRISDATKTPQKGNSETEKNREDTLKHIWEESKHRHIFDPFTKVVDFSNRRPTDYEMNTRVKLPRPLDLEGEFQCEIRRRAYKETFDSYQQIKGVKPVSKQDNTRANLASGSDIASNK